MFVSLGVIFLNVYNKVGLNQARRRKGIWRMAGDCRESGNPNRPDTGTERRRWKYLVPVGNSKGSVGWGLCGAWEGAQRKARPEIPPRAKEQPVRRDQVQICRLLQGLAQ